MAKLLAKCVFCNQQFDRNEEEFVAVNNRRYAHKKCYDAVQDEKDYEELINYIKKIFKYTSISAKVTRQITDYKKQYGFTYSGMKKALVWWFEVKKNSVEAANGGIGILPYIYNDAKTYYYGLYLAQLANKNKTIHTQIEEIEIAPPEVYVQPPRLFDLGEERHE